MNKPTPFGKQTFAEYEKEVKEYKAFNLKAQKIELSLAGDLTDLGKELKTTLSKGDKEYDSAFKAEKEARKIIQDLEGYSKELNAAAGRLQSQIDAGFNLLNDAEDSAKELGLAAKDIPGFMSAYDIISQAEDAVTKYEQLANDIEDIN